MKIIFDDATEISGQQVRPKGDYLQILSLESPETLREHFLDPLKTKKITIQERGQTIATYEGYTTLYRVEAYAASIYGIVMYKPEKTPEVQAEVQQAAVLVAQMQAQSLTDAQALTVKAIYPQWRDIIGQTVDAGFKFLHGDVLYKTIQDSLLIQEQFIPGEGTESLYTTIDETHAGTEDDPIPYNGNMALENGKYYIQGGITYLCNRDTEIPVYQPLADLVGLYVEAAG